MNYYMWTGGNNYGRWTGDSITHMYGRFPQEHVNKPSFFKKKIQTPRLEAALYFMECMLTCVMFMTSSPS